MNRSLWKNTMKLTTESKRIYMITANAKTNLQPKDDWLNWKYRLKQKLRIG